MDERTMIIVEGGVPWEMCKWADFFSVDIEPGIEDCEILEPRPMTEAEYAEFVAAIEAKRAEVNGG